MHGILGTRYQNEIRMAQLCRTGYITHGYTRNTFKNIEIRKIGNPWKPDHCQINLTNLLMITHAFTEAVLIFHLDVQIRSHSHYRNFAFFFQHFYARIQNGLIAPEFVDNKAFDHISLIFFQKFHCTIKLCKNSASVNISGQKHRGFCHFCHSHIDDIFIFQINLRRGASSLQHNDICLFFQGMIRLHNIRHQLFFIFEIAPCTHGREYLSIDDHLGTSIIRRF